MRAIFPFLSVLLAVACTAEEDASGDECVPDSRRVCACPAGGQSEQTCKADGTGFGVCLGCAGAGGSSGAGPDAGGAAGDGGTGGTSSACSEGDCSGCSSCQDRCLCEGSDAQRCFSVCADGGGGSGGGDSGTGGAPAAGLVTCGLTNPDLCASGTEKCCIIDPGFDYCSAASTDCACEGFGCNALEAFCDGPEDCPEGQVCCGLFTGTRYTRFECQSSCVAQDAEFEICHEGATQCSQAGTTCSRSQVLPSWYQRCRT